MLWLLSMSAYYLDEAGDVADTPIQWSESHPHNDLFFVVNY